MADQYEHMKAMNELNEWPWWRQALYFIGGWVVMVGVLFVVYIITIMLGADSPPYYE